MKQVFLVLQAAALLAGTGVCPCAQASGIPAAAEDAAQDAHGNHGAHDSHGDGQQSPAPCGERACIGHCAIVAATADRAPAAPPAPMPAWDDAAAAALPAAPAPKPEHRAPRSQSPPAFFPRHAVTPVSRFERLLA